MNEKTLTENLKETQKGANPLVYVRKDLINKPEYGLNSWFIIGHFNNLGHTISYLFHIMAMKMPILGQKYLAVASVTDHTTGEYIGQDKMFSKKEVKIDDQAFDIEMPDAYMRGSWDDMYYGFTLKDWKLEGHGKVMGYPILSKRTGAFELLDMYVHQYSLPFMAITGTLTNSKRTYDITSDAWFDRQWQNQNMKNVLRWSWIAIYLDNGEVYSVFDCDVPAHQQHWVTILREDGSLDFVDLEPLENGMSCYWTSPESKQTYPTKLVVRVPAEEAVLTLQPAPKEQEIVSCVSQQLQILGRLNRT